MIQCVFLLCCLSQPTAGLPEARHVEAAGPTHGTQEADSETRLAIHQTEPEEQLQTTLARWRLDLELDQPGEILRDGPRLVRTGEPLAASGECVSLVARALFSAGKEAEALRLIEQARPADASGAAHIALASASFAIERDQLEEALSTLLDETGKPHFPDAPDAWLLAGRALARLGQGAQAEPYLARFLQLAPLHPGAPSAWHMRAQHAITRRDGVAAKDFSARAQSATRWQSYKRARELQKRAEPTAPLPRLGLAQLWLQVGEFEEARNELQELLRIAPDFARGWSHLAQALRALEEIDAAFAAFDRALELEPVNIHARLGRGRLASEQGRDALAESDLRQVFEEGQSDPGRQQQAGLLLARLLLEQTRQAEAQSIYARYRELGGSEELQPRRE